jgi:hypothetical protein
MNNEQMQKFTEALTARLAELERNLADLKRERDIERGRYTYRMFKGEPDLEDTPPDSSEKPESKPAGPR